MLFGCSSDPSCTARRLPHCTFGQLVVCALLCLSCSCSSRRPVQLSSSFSCSARRSVQLSLTSSLFYSCFSIHAFYSRFSIQSGSYCSSLFSSCFSILFLTYNGRLLLSTGKLELDCTFFLLEYVTNIALSARRLILSSTRCSVQISLARRLVRSDKIRSARSLPIAQLVLRLLSSSFG